MNNGLNSGKRTLQQVFILEHGLSKIAAIFAV